MIEERKESEEKDCTKRVLIEEESKGNWNGRTLEKLKKQRTNFVMFFKINDFVFPISFAPSLKLQFIISNSPSILSTENMTENILGLPSQ